MNNDRQLAWTLMWLEHKTNGVLSNLDPQRQLTMREVLERVELSDGTPVSWKRGWRHDTLLQRAHGILRNETVPPAPAEFVARSDPEFPESLAQMRGAPFGIFVRGNRDVISNTNKPEGMRNVAIVGARKARADSVATTHKLASELGRAGICIVSGLAIGVDGAAHRAAVEIGAPTIAVLGSGFDFVYPTRHRYLAEQILDEGGALVSEYAMNSPSYPIHFPARNRIIAGLSSYVVVIQAAAQSGSLQTVDFALEMGIDVGVVPSAIGDTAYGGSLALLREGGRAIVDARSVLDDLGVAPVEKGVSHEFGAFLDCPRHPDELAREFHLPSGDVLVRLLDLELAGTVVRTLDGSYCNAP